MSAALQNEMERLQARISELEEREQALEHHLEMLQEKQNADTCACSHDEATDVCLGHSPMLRLALEREQALAAHVERLGHVIVDAKRCAAVVAFPSNYNAPDYQSFAKEVMRNIEALSKQEPITSLARRDLIKQAEVLEEAVKVCEKERDSQDRLAWMHKEVGSDGEEYIGERGIGYSNKALGATHCVDELQRLAKKLRQQAEAMK